MTAFLSIAALISAIITIAAKMRENSAVQYVFKPLTMCLIILTAILNVSSPTTFYQKMIIVGLIFSTVGDVFLINPKRFVQGLLSFLIAHIFFAAAFYSTPHLPSVVFYFAYFIFFLQILWKHLGKLKIPVIIYALAIVTMAWLALSRYLAVGDDKTLYAFVGSIFFTVSDSLIAYKKFRSPFPFAEVFILASYFIAQWLIALSI